MLDLDSRCGVVEGVLPHRVHPLAVEFQHHLKRKGGGAVVGGAGVGRKGVGGATDTTVLNMLYWTAIEAGHNQCH